MSQSLAQNKCQPCEGMGSSLNSNQVQEKSKFVPEWNVSSDHKMISREFVVKNFMAAIHFIGKIAQIAEEENHHPDIHLTSYRRLKIDLSTHAVGGLSDNDFILAEKIDQLPVELRK